MLTAKQKPRRRHPPLADRSAERARQDYVKAIYQLGGDRPVSGASLARYLAVSRAAVTKSRRLLERQHLVRPAESRTDLIELTDNGRRLAENMLRRHRLIETLLHKLGVPLDELHRQAEAIEHVISDDVAARLARFLGNPKVDPHGHPIAGSPQRGAKAMPLSDVSPGTRIRIETIPDRDPVLVRRLLAQRVLPGLAAVVVVSNGTVRLRSARQKTHAVASSAASLIGVTVVKQAERRR